MNLLTIAALVLLAQLGTQPAAQQEKPVEKASIEGIILRAATGEPLGGAEVKVTRVLQEEDFRFIVFDTGDPSTQGLPTVTTQTDGKFVIKDLDPGQYQLTVARNGYAQQTYGQKSDTSPARVINLIPGETLKDIAFRMVQASVITGRVRDSAGEPVPGVGVVLLRIQTAENRRMLLPVDEVQTDDRGEYRLFWIKPGRYYLKVRPRSRYGFSPNSSRIIVDPTLPSTYYPGTLDVSSASAIDIQPGAELGAVDFVLPKPAGHWIRGRVVDGSTGKPPKSVNLSLSPKEPAAFSDGDYRESALTDYNPTTGVFSMRNVAPGQYWLTATSSTGFDEPISPERLLAEVRTTSDLYMTDFSSSSAAQIAVDMPLSDVNDIVLTLKRGNSIPVRLRVEGPDPASLKDIDKVRLSLNPVSQTNTYRESTRLNSEGAAKIEDVPPGEYRVFVSMPKSVDLYVKEILYGRNDALHDPVHITDEQPSTLSVLLSDKGGRVEGTLTDTVGQPVSGAAVALIADLRERETSTKTATTDRDGHFVFKNLAPGGYKLFSWEDPPADYNYDKQMLSKYEALGQAVQIQESSKAKVDLKIIPETKQ